MSNFFVFCPQPGHVRVGYEGFYYTVFSFAFVNFNIISLKWLPYLTEKGN